MRLSSTFLTLLACILAALLTGCTSLRNGGAPDPAFTVQADMAALKQALSSTASITAYYGGAATDARRNAFADSRVAMANLVYIQFIGDLTADKQHLDAASDLLVLGLNLLGTAATGVRAQANLAATAAGVGGSKAIVDKNYYYEKTISALVATMNASRKEVLLRILEGVRKPLAEYTFSQAVADTHDYYAAGTLNSAIASAQAAAATREIKADRILSILGEAKVLTDEQIDDRKIAVNAIGAAVKRGDLAEIQGLLKQLGLAGLAQATVDEATASLLDKYRDALRAKPELAKEINAKLKKEK